MAGNRIEFTINASQSKSENLQFVAQSVIVDNPNSYYVYFPYLRRWVPPFTGGAVLRYGVEPSIAAFETDLLPPNIIASLNPIDAGARIIFVEDLIPESGGSSTQVGLVQNVNVVTGSTIIATPGSPPNLQSASFSIQLTLGAFYPILGAPSVTIIKRVWKMNVQQSVSATLGAVELQAFGVTARIHTFDNTLGGGPGFQLDFAGIEILLPAGSFGQFGLQNNNNGTSAYYTGSLLYSD